MDADKSIFEILFFAVFIAGPLAWFVGFEKSKTHKMEMGTQEAIHKAELRAAKMEAEATKRIAVAEALAIERLKALSGDASRPAQMIPATDGAVAVSPAASNVSPVEMTPATYGVFPIESLLESPGRTSSEEETASTWVSEPDEEFWRRNADKLNA